MDIGNNSTAMMYSYRFIIIYYTRILQLKSVYKKKKTARTIFSDGEIHVVQCHWSSGKKINETFAHSLPPTGDVYTHGVQRRSELTCVAQNINNNTIITSTVRAYKRIFFFLFFSLDFFFFRKSY